MSTASAAAAAPAASAPNRGEAPQTRREPDVIEQKVKRISELFATLTESPTTTKGLNSEKENVQDNSPRKKLPRSLDEFYNRVDSFEPGLWAVDQISPLECASWGWKLLEQDVLQCVSCKEVIWAMLPSKKSKVLYDNFINLLKTRIETSHKDACGWLYNPCPAEFMDPLVINGEQLRNMKNSVQTLAALNSALPFVNIKRLSAILGTDDEITKALLKNDEAEDEAKITAVLLVLCGWSKGQGSYLRCMICRRKVGLWSLVTIADEIKKTEPSKAQVTPTSRKRKLSEPGTNSTEEGDDNQRVLRQSPRLKNQEPKDWPTPKRMRTRSKEEKKDDASSPQKPEEKPECLLITSPTTQIEKVEKRYFIPLDEHRFWCPWIAKVDHHDEDEDDDDPLKGFCIVVEQIRELLQVSQQRKSYAHEKYAENVEGLRIIRSLLDEVSISPD
ncbi:zinc finger C3HC-type protein 1-like isoform X2 [Macrobrachium rosenbergii]|uniref:zinc finger C3HC-type protein 1-like isoform X2 n=1 Tax=Macrobrachium rosenbergii TaxID=79674 RepID=UPI0034D4F21F